MLNVFNSFLKKEESNLNQPIRHRLGKIVPDDNKTLTDDSHGDDSDSPDMDSGDSFGDSFVNLVQIGEEVRSHVESGNRPPDETLVDTLTVMKNMLA